MQQPPTAALELVCPAGSLRALQLAVNAGADAVYLGLKGATNARNFAGLNFDGAQLSDGVAYAHGRGAKVLMALNTFAPAGDEQPWYRAVDAAVAAGADALIVADTAVMAYARDHHPSLRLHLSVQASATSHEAIDFYRRHYGIQRAVLPRVLTLSQVGHVLRHSQVEIEVFGFGSLCVMVEGRCALSSYVTGAVAQQRRRVFAAVGGALDRDRRRRRIAPERRADRPLRAPTSRAATRRCARAASKSTAGATTRSRSRRA